MIDEPGYEFDQPCLIGDANERAVDSSFHERNDTTEASIVSKTEIE
jgi:hypothetical protein